MPKAYILVGVPGSGKSTWISSAPVDWNNTVVASTDNYVEKEAKRQGKTYTEVFKDVMPDAVKHMAKTVVDAVRNNQNIIWDQTSTTRHTRAKKLRMLPNNYEVIALVFPTPDKKELARRLGNRPGKTIPDEIVNDMITRWEEPTEDEGFDKIIHVR
jgi:predicted kinase